MVKLVSGGKINKKTSYTPIFSTYFYPVCPILFIYGKKKALFLKKREAFGASLAAQIAVGGHIKINERKLDLPLKVQKQLAFIQP